MLENFSHKAPICSPGCVMSLSWHIFPFECMISLCSISFHGSQCLLSFLIRVEDNRHFFQYCSNKVTTWNFFVHGTKEECYMDAVNFIEHLRLLVPPCKGGLDTAKLNWKLKIDSRQIKASVILKLSQEEMLYIFPGVFVYTYACTFM